ncbi:MAG: hypothetical protein M3R23_00405 [Actinomycetota bacterium]|nr:hypothetical protein [Actinomycetota bacterium]
MPSPEGIYQGSVRALSVVMVGIGAAILVLTLASGGGPLSLGILLGLAFVAVGIGRLWIVSRMKR